MYFRYDYPENYPEEMIPMCVYADTTGLYTEEECEECNLAYLLFPREIVEAFFDEEVDYIFVPGEGVIDFDTWLRTEYTADELIDLCEFAKGRGFEVVRYQENKA